MIDKSSSANFKSAVAWLLTAQFFADNSSTSATNRDRSLFLLFYWEAGRSWVFGQ